MLAASHSIATNTSKPTINQAQPRRNTTAAATVSRSTAALQQLINNIAADLGASASQATPPDANQ